jgi:phosphatidylglycerol:prolipoprotein diacylglycerol transferase
LIPYLQIPSLPIFDSIAIHPFGVLVATGILVGATLTRRRGRKLGLDDENVKSMIFWSVFTGFIVSHVCDVLFYQDHRDTRSMLLALADPRSGLSSMFGFAGAVLGLVGWCKRNKEPIMPYADSLAYGLAVGWMFGRMGCYVAHDHPGNLVNHEWYSFLGVDYPCPEPHCPVDPSKGWIVSAANSNPAFRRYDMGFFEVLIAGALAAFYFIAERFKPRCGFFVAAIAIYYGPVRFVLDYLRVKGVAGADPRWPAGASWGLTPAQYAAVLVSLCGLALIVRVLQKPPLYPSD